VVFGALAWATTVYWLDRHDLAEGPALRAVTLALGLTGIFVGSFLTVMKLFVFRMQGLVKDLGPKRSFDEHRIHAAGLQLLGELAAGLTHEIHNPLTSISGYVFQIEEELKEPTQEHDGVISKALGRIRANAEKILSISKSMKGFARETSRDPFETVSVRAVIEETLLLIRHHIRSAGVDLRVDLPEIDVMVRGHSVQLTQVLANLLSNARDACLSSERKIVSIGFRRKDDLVQIWVEDSGAGISADIQDDIFRPFFTTKPAGQGTGLGLHIAQVIVQRHESKLSYVCPKDASGRVLGTRFCLELKALDSKVLPSAA
jgi:C4-dicarboxylate-specific signal transduction histidine kinase